jgi:hypothetical protein
MYQAKAYAALKERLAIDIDKIDDALMQTSFDMQSAAEHCAAAIKLRDAATHNLELAKTEAGIALRQEDDKISEAKIASLTPRDGIVQDCYEALDAAKHDAAVWASLVEAYKEKGASLRRIGDMILAGFITPTSMNAERRAQLHAVREAARERPRL